MKITVFTGNQPRHLSLIEGLSAITSEVYAVIECGTVFPGKVADFFKKSIVMQNYFEKVKRAEQVVFGEPRFINKNVRQLVIKSGDLNLLSLDLLRACLKSDAFIVFGASYIKPPLVDVLISTKRVFNIHMGTSPYYRGSSCNFWAAYDQNYDYIGATIHLLSRGLDSGDILFHTFPEPDSDPFVLGMKAVKSAHAGLIQYLEGGGLDSLKPITQDKKLEIRYTRNSDFTDQVAEDYLTHLPDAPAMLRKLNNRDVTKFIRPSLG